MYLKYAAAFTLHTLHTSIWQEASKGKVALLVQGGIIDTAPAWKQADREFLLAIEDPLEPGREMSSGSFEIQQVRRVTQHMILADTDVGMRFCTRILMVA